MDATRAITNQRSIRNPTPDPEMRLCLVTDRRRLGSALGAQPAHWIATLEQQVASAAATGVDMIQVREPDLEAAELTALVRSLVRLVEGTRTKVLVNDRIDVAIVSGASGVHLKECGVLPDAVRRIAPPGFLIGCSVHTIASASLRKSADFLIAGTVLPTVSKSSAPYLEEAGLRQIVLAAAGQPVLGIGGLDLSSVRLLVSSGAAGLAAVGAFIPSSAEDVTEFLQKRVSALRFALESSSTGT